MTARRLQSAPRRLLYLLRLELLDQLLLQRDESCPFLISNSLVFEFSGQKGGLEKKKGGDGQRKERGRLTVYTVLFMMCWIVLQFLKMILAVLKLEKILKGNSEDFITFTDCPDLKDGTQKTLIKDKLLSGFNGLKYCE